MENREEAGYLLLFLGVVILLFTFYLGYRIYVSATAIHPPSASPQINYPSVGSGSNASSIIGPIITGAIQSVTSSLNLSAYANFFIEIIVLYLFANVGYKIAKLGVEMLVEMQKREKKGGKNGE
jgi:hypothetical protein